MPKKPKHPCAYPGCPALTDRRYCEEHEKLTSQQYEKYGRDPATRRRYGRAWQRIRNAYAKEHPLCEQCLAEAGWCRWNRSTTNCRWLKEEPMREAISYRSVLPAMHASMPSAATGGTTDDPRGGLNLQVGRTGKRCRGLVCSFA